MRGKMPVVLRLKGFKFWFYQADLEEPPHVHIGKDGNEAKYWLDPIALARSGRFREHELNKIEKILKVHQSDILEVWRKEERKRDNR